MPRLSARFQGPARVSALRAAGPKSDELCRVRECRKISAAINRDAGVACGSDACISSGTGPIECSATENMAKKVAKPLPLRLRTGRKTDARAQFAALCWRVKNDKVQVCLSPGRLTGQRHCDIVVEESCCGTKKNTPGCCRHQRGQPVERRNRSSKPKRTQIPKTCWAYRARNFIFVCKNTSEHCMCCLQSRGCFRQFLAGEN